MRTLLSILLASLVLAHCSSSTSGGNEKEVPTYRFSASASPSGGGSVSPSSGTYDEGAEVRVEASASDGWQFREWTGDISSTDNPLTFTISSDTELTANFEETTPTYRFSASASPSGGGSVTPDSAHYDEGTEVQVEATPAAGWEFVNWTGDTLSADNPLAFTIASNTTLTANFNELPAAFEEVVTITDGKSSRDLDFGMDPNATAGFDQGIDEEAPPEPPSGSFYTHFHISGYNLFRDFRSVTEQKISWKLEFAPEDGRSISLNWDFSETDHVGSLTLADAVDNPSFEIDMKSSSSHSVSESVTTLYIISEAK